WSNFLRSPATGGNGDYDTVAFSGFGIWSKDNVTTVAQAIVQVCSSQDFHYVGIQIDAGAISNGNTKPAPREDPLPREISFFRWLAGSLPVRLFGVLAERLLKDADERPAVAAVLHVLESSSSGLLVTFQVGGNILIRQRLVRFGAGIRN